MPKKPKELLLMIPGPITVSPEVLNVMGEPVRAHYGDEFRDTYNEITAMLARLFATQGDVFLMVGSGSCAIDTCFGSAFSSGEKVLVGINGFFGERLAAIARGYNLQVIEVRAEFGKPISLEAVKTALKEHPDASGFAVVHLETSTTIVNPIKDYGAICREHGILYFVDTVSSLGGLPVYMDEWGIDLCASASQKCLGSPPGLAPVAVGGRGWQFIDRQPDKGHGWYTNLRTWRQYKKDWADWHPYPVTLATNNILALMTSLEHLLEEGVEQRMQRYRCLALYLRKRLREIGWQPYTSDEMLAPVITAAYGPAGVPTGKVIHYMESEHQIKIAGGLGPLKDKIIRIGHMSPIVSETLLDRVVDALAGYHED